MTSVVYEDRKLPGYEGQLIAGMALTSRVQASRLVADGSTFATVDTEALLTTNDRSFRPVDMAVGPDGAIYVADWCDIRMDHTDPRDTWDKSCGRIWRLRATAAPPVPRFDLASEPTARLVQLLGDERKWYRDHARRLLAERRDRTMLAQLQRTAREKRGQVALEALWTVNLIGGMDPQWASSLLNHPDASIRYWTLRLLTDHGSTPLGVEEQLIGLARSEPDPEVRSELANAAGHLQTRAALSVVRELIRRPEDLSDKHIPLRVWWTLEALIGRDADAVLTWLEEADVWRAPLFVGQLASRIAQRLAAERGDRPSFRRLDPDENWKLYALHPRSPMPDRKGDYTDWETNDTPEVSRRNLSRLTRLLDIAPADLQDRLLDGARAGLGAGPPAREMPPRLRTLLAAFEKKRDANAGAGDVKLERGRTDFLTYCAPCHQNDGSGMARLAKPLRNSAWVLGDERSLARIVLHGLKSELLMPPMGTLSDEQLALIATYIRSAWGHDAGPISPELIANVRAASRNRTTPWTTAELDALRLER
jgi:mono/diheme cytochrome c family protein